MDQRCQDFLDRIKHEDAKLIDVREPMEVVHGKLPCSVNVPMALIYQISEMFEPDDTLFLYCHTGRRSAQAAIILQNMGYPKAENVGGINDYYECIVDVCS